MDEGKKSLGPNSLSRRDFIQYSTAFAGGVALTSLCTDKLIAAPSSENKEIFWYRKPLRIMHTVLRETDAKHYDAEAVIDYIQKSGANVLCVNAGGIVDFFQNPLPAANINSFMGKRDILKEITTACQRAGIKVIARIDLRGVEEHVYKKLPDWFGRDVNQNPLILTWTKPRLYASCYSGYYRNEYANDFVRYVMKNYAVDGIWHNSPGYQGICYCARCAGAYSALAGKTIPAINTAAEDELNQYMVWKAQAADQYMGRIRETVKSFGDDKAYTAEVFSIYSVGQQIDSGIDLNNARNHFDILVSVAFLTENDETIQYEDLNYGNTIIKFLKSMVPEREAVVMYGGNGTSHRLVIDPPVDLNVWLWEILSAGGRFWNCYFTNVPTVTHDRRNAFNESEAYHFVKENEKLLEHHVPVANIGIYYSRPTRLSYREKKEEGDAFGADIRGMEMVMMENHIPHDFILDDQVSKVRLQKYNLIILPNVRCMSETEMTILKAFVHDGGNLLATYTTSLYNTEGKERQDYGLAELFGVQYTGKKVNTRKDNYQFILNKQHPLVAEDSPNTELLFHAGYTALSKPTTDADVICTWVPAIQNQPPDKAWVEKFSTEFPTIVQNNYGKGKVIYFAGQPDVLSYIQGHPDPRNLLHRSIRLLAGSTIPVETTAPESVHMGLTKSLTKPGQYILSMVNTTSGPGRPVRSLIPVHDIIIKLRLEGKSVANYKVLRSQGKCRIQSREGTLNLQIGTLKDFCAIHIQMNT